MKTAYPTISDVVTITLYRNIPFDNSYKHHTIISDRFKFNSQSIYTSLVGEPNPCERFLNMKRSGQYVFPRTTKTDSFNFDFSNGLVASLTLQLTAQETNSNYMRVKCGNDYYYYFITGISQLNYETYKLNLELDVIMTYQDEFIDGMADVPVFTKRKHCHRYTSDGLMPYCADLKTGDDAFAGVKPNIITQHHALHYKNSEMKKLEMSGSGLMWLYVCCDVADYDVSTDTYNMLERTFYGFGAIKSPMVMLALPIDAFGTSLYKNDNTCVADFTREQMLHGIDKLIGDGSVHGCKISPYPPFSIQQANDGAVDITLGIYHMTSPNVNVVQNDNLAKIYQMRVGGSSITYGTTSVTTRLPTFLELMLKHGFMLLSEETTRNYIMDTIGVDDLGIKNSVAPTINSNKYLDPKLLFNPFRKYVLNAPYESQGVEFYPELIYSQYPTEIIDGYSGDIGFETNATCYIGDNNFYTKIKSSTPTFDNYQYEKIGLASAVNYIFPCGTNALDVFNSTQAQSFYQSKTASGITSGLTMAGGVASIGLGVAGLVGAFGTGGMSAIAGAGLIAGGATTLASGTASLVDTFKSTNAKIEDLKNTPNSINISGSNIFTDMVITKNYTMFPYVDVYEVSPVIKESADEYFYNFGYQVSRYCYFNQELEYDNSSNKKVDNNLFGRTIFNYIQISEDIVNKIDADIPLIIKQKLSAVFNQGITIWNFFGFSYLWGSEPSIVTNEDYTKWFMKQTYDNTEYNN